jgi:non-specific serine/threonine protein kinase
VEEPNLRAGFEWAITVGQTNLALTLAGALHAAWYIRGNYTEACAWFDRALALPGGLPEARVQVLNWSSNHALAAGDIPGAVARSRAAQRLVAGCDNPTLHALAIDGFATILAESGNVPRAEALFTIEKALCDQFDLTGLGRAVLYRLAALRLERGFVDSAEELAEEALRGVGEKGNLWMHVRILNVLARVALMRQELTRAAGYLATALDRARHIQDSRGTIDVLCVMADLESVRGNARIARRLIGEAFERCQANGEALAFPRVLDVNVGMRALTRPEAALRLAGAVNGLRRRTRIRRLPYERLRHEAALETALRQLRADAGRAAIASGEELSSIEAVALARELLQAAETDAPGRSTVQAGVSLLTAREADVAALMARGLSNRAIGEALFISEGTVRGHVEHILGKLGVKSRVQVAGRIPSRTRRGPVRPTEPMFG